jgi:mono/diheme cytochrome c family protein
MKVFFIATFLAACGCSRAGPYADSKGETPAARRLGEVMVGVGGRFETAGRAAIAGRFELAEFEASEIGEAFEDDVPHAVMPKEGPTAHIPVLAADFARTLVPELQKAAASKDSAAFSRAFAAAAAACNACHAASGKPFLQVPAVPGKPVPDVEPVAPPARDR